VVLSTARLNRILRMDAYSRTAVVQPGVRNLAISDAAAQHGLYYAPDPSSQIACTIGGNVAENSGGVHCLKYGLTVHNVLRVRMVTIEGEVLELGSEALDAAGLDLLSVFIGSEGMLGIVTEVTVKLVPKPACARVIMASFDEVVAGCNAVAALIAAGIIPAGLEMMDQTSSRMVEPFVHAGYDTEAAAILLCEADGTAEEVEEEIARMSAVLQQAGASAIAVSQSEAERMKFWSGRKNAFPRRGASRPTTTAWTAPSRVSDWGRCWRGSRRWRSSMACAAPMCSMRAMAICTR
jgi:glycolate oxidase